MGEWEYVSSSNLEAIKYDEDTMELHVRFQNQSEYVYHNVQPELYFGLQNAPSKGSYLNRMIKAAGYQYSKVN